MQTNQSGELDRLARDARASGDDADLTTLLRSAEPIVLAVCHRVLPHHHDAEEAAQDALLSIARSFDSFDPARGAFAPWARTIAGNSARDTYRRLKRHASGELPPDPVDPVRTSVVAGSRVDLLEAIEALEQDHPAIVESFVLRDLAGLSYDEIADQTGTKVGSVKAHVSRARTFLRERLVVP